jgi:DnaD/phage-associated family protein
MSVEFLPIPQLPQLPQQNQEPVPVKAPCASPKSRIYDPEELELYKNRGNGISELFEKAEKALCNCVTSTDLGIVYSLYDWLGLPMDVIGCLLDYCATRGIKSSRYIEKVGINWSESNVTSVEEAKEHLRNYEKPYREILRAMGINQNYPAESQKEFIDKWLVDFNMPVESVKEAVKIAFYSKNTATFAYVNGILKRWHEAGLHTLEECQNAPAAPPKKAFATKSAIKGTFSNFAQRDYDFELLEKLEREYNKNSVKDRLQRSAPMV